MESSTESKACCNVTTLAKEQKEEAPTERKRKYEENSKIKPTRKSRRKKCKNQWGCLENFYWMFCWLFLAFNQHSTSISGKQEESFGNRMKPYRHPGFSNRWIAPGPHRCFFPLLLKEHKKLTFITSEKNLRWISCILNLADVIIYGQNFETHFSCLSLFAEKHLKILRHVVDHQSIRPNQMNLTKPKT